MLTVNRLTWASWSFELWYTFGSSSVRTRLLLIFSGFPVCPLPLVQFLLQCFQMCPTVHVYCPCQVRKIGRKIMVEKYLISMTIVLLHILRMRIFRQAEWCLQAVSTSFQQRLLFTRKGHKLPCKYVSPYCWGATSSTWRRGENNSCAPKWSLRGHVPLLHLTRQATEPHSRNAKASIIPLSSKCDRRSAKAVTLQWPLPVSSYLKHFCSLTPFSAASLSSTHVFAPLYLSLCRWTPNTRPNLQPRCST